MPKIKIPVPIRSSPTPKVEEDAKSFARKAFQFVDHETNILAGSTETKHPTRQMANIEIFCCATQVGLKNETRRVFIETNS
jgi:hypothetical protein